MTRRLLVIAVLMSCMTACALRPTIPGTSVRWDDRRETLLDLTNWQARGRIAVKSDTGGGQGNIQWQQSDAGARIRVNGPFGAGAYELTWSADKITVTDKYGEVSADYTGPGAAERLLNERLGWSFPADSTRFWILGIANPDYPASEHFDPDGWLASIEQNGWLIAYEGFATRSGNWLPRRIVMENEQARVKLVVDRWLL